MIKYFRHSVQKLLDYLDDPKIDVGERLFVILSLISGIGLIAAIIGGVIIGENPSSLIVTVIVFLVFATVVFIGVRVRRVDLAAVIVSVLSIFVLTPVTFFTSGGIYGGTPIWCVFSVLYIGMILSGKIRLFFYLAASVVISFCWYVQYNMPFLILEHSRDAAFSDSLGSLFIVSVVLNILVIFQARLYIKENKKSEQQKQRIEELNAAQSRFFSSMSHEIRTPINTIIGLNEMILRENASEEINEDAENIKAASNILLHLINDILDMSKLESGQMELDIHTYNTGDMLSDIVGMFWLMAQEKGLIFAVDIAPDMPAELSGDEIRIRQILINVINNAIKYTQAGSVKLSVQIERQEGNFAKVIYTVSDTGMGIRKESIPHLFDAFSRIDEEGNRYIEGTGLGLSIVKQFVDLMGGTISVNSIYTKGSTFVITIPQRIIDGNAMEEIHIERRRDPKQRTPYLQSFEAPEAKVLVVDDTESNLMVVEKLLRATKVQVTLARSGAEALKATLDTEFNVIFMDHMMPEMDGIECMHRIRNQTGGMCKKAPIVALTANAGSADAALYNKEGFDGYLVKPITGDVIEKELRRLLPGMLITFTGRDEKVIEESMSWKKDYHKKSAVAITTESVADIPSAIRKKYDIGIIPYRVATESGIFKDGEELQTMGILAYMRSGRKAYSIPPDVADYERFFADQLAKASNVIHLGLSGNVERSGYENALEAAKSFDNVFVIDTGQLSGGLCMMVLDAIRLAEDGRGPAYIREWVHRTQDTIRTSFVVNNIDYMASQYQVSAWMAKFVNAFLLRPLIHVRDGKIRMFGFWIGTRQRAEKHYIDKVLSTPHSIDKSLLIIAYTGLTVDELDRIRSEVEKQAKFEQVIIQSASPAITVNCGPGAFGLIYRTI